MTEPLEMYDIAIDSNRPVTKVDIEKYRVLRIAYGHIGKIVRSGKSLSDVITKCEIVEGAFRSASFSPTPFETFADEIKDRLND